MLSVALFCHKKDDAEHVISLLAEKSGLFQADGVIRSIIESGDKDYEGYLSLNGKNTFDRSSGSIVHKSFDGCQVVYSLPEEEKADGALVSKQLEQYLFGKNIPVNEILFLQKLCLSINEALNENEGFVYVGLSSCPFAAIAIDAIKSIFVLDDILISLPESLYFALPSIASHEEIARETNPDGVLTLEEGYEVFFDDVVGIASPDFTKIKKIAPAETKKESFVLLHSFANKMAPVLGSKVGKKLSELDHDTKRDAFGDVFFSVLFAILSIASPYFYFSLLSKSDTVYFVLYLVLDVFFVLMSSLSAAYLADIRKKLPKKVFLFGIIVPPALKLIASIILLPVSKATSWGVTEVYAFFGLGLAYLLIYPAVIFAYLKFFASRKKKKRKQSE
jgi:hypothetical protein